MAALHFIAGKAGSGKTTLARQLGETLPAVVICEDEWMARLADPIENLAQYMTAARRIRSVTGPLAMAMLKVGTSVVFDFAGNTRREREWVRTLGESAKAAVVLHYIEADDSICRDRVRQRNAARPEGLYYGDVTMEQVEEANQFFELPSPTEGFEMMRHFATGQAASG